MGLLKKKWARPDLKQSHWIVFEVKNIKELTVVTLKTHKKKTQKKVKKKWKKQQQYD